MTNCPPCATINSKHYISVNTTPQQIFIGAYHFEEGRPLRIFFTSEHTVSRRKDASRWRRRAWDAHHFAKEEGSSHPQTRRALQALVCLQRSCFAASSAFREVPKKEGVVSLKRGNSFFVQKKHSDYENPNACGRM